MLTGDSMGRKKQGSALLARLRRSTAGAAAAEFGLILPVMLLITAGGLQYGTMLYTYNSMINGARSGARALSLGDTTAGDVRAAVKGWMPIWVAADAVTVTTTDVGTDRVRVDVSIPSTSATVFRLAPMPATLDASVLMMREN